VAHPDALRANNVTLTELLDAARGASQNSSAGVYTEGAQEYVLEAVGRVRSAEEIGETVVALRGDRSVLVRDVADVREGAAFKRGEGSRSGKPAVIVGVQKQPGANTIDVTARAFPTRRLRVAPRFVDPSPTELERIRSEARRLDELFNTVTPADRVEGFVPPLPGVPGSNFGSRSIFNGEARAPHAGADFRGATGTPIPAPAAGRVVLAEDLFFTGNTVVIDHGLGLYSLLAHLSRIDVTPGSPLARGDVVGLLGATGHQLLSSFGFQKRCSRVFHKL